MNPWVCKIKHPESWTVGALADMECSGEPVVVPENQAAFIKFKNKEDERALKILSEKKFESSTAEFVVTSYKPGDFPSLPIEIQKGDLILPVQPVAFTVQSVLNPQQPSEMQGPYGPYLLSYPTWVWIAVVVVFAMIIYGIIYPIRLRKKNRKLFVEMSAFKTPIPASHQLRKDLMLFIRKLEQPGEVAVGNLQPKEELQEICKHYLIRQFLVPAHAKSVAYCLREIQRKYPRHFLAWGDELKRVSAEIKNMHEGQDWSVDDYQQVVSSLSRLSERIHESLLNEAKLRSR